MKTSHILPLLLALALVARAAVPFEWTADIDRPAPAQFAVLRGETVRLSASLARGGAPWDPAAESATLYWQTNGMGEAWWTAPASVASNVLSAEFTAAMDPGAPMVTAFLGARDADGALYRAFATLRFIHAPGATPNEIPLPARTIDFATVQVENAPWASTGYVDAAVAAATPADYAAVSNAAMSAVQAETDPLFAEWANTNSLLRHAAFIASNEKPIRFVVKNVLSPEITVLNNRVKAFGLSLMLPPGVDQLRDVGDGLFAIFTGPETAVLARIYNGLDPDADRYMVTSGEFGFDQDFEGWPSVEFLGEELEITTERSPVATAADVAAATNAIPAPDLSALVPTNRTIAGVALDADIPLAGGLTVTNGALRVYDAAPDGTLSNLLWDSSSAADTATVADLARRVAALESGGGAASWADYDAQGNANPDSDIVMLNRAFTAIGSGFYWASSGGHYCLCSAGSVAYLADAGGSLRLFGSSISNYVGIVAGGTVTVGANADGFEVVGGVASITYPWSGGAHPTVYGAATITGPWTEMTSAVWVDDADAGTATASFPADQTSFFFKATTTAQLGEHLESTLPAHLPGGVMTRANDLDPVIYDSTITITSGGHTYRIPAQLVQ